MKTFALIATLTLPVAALTLAAPQENTKFPPERHAEITALLAAD
ncbi:hypothetical protein AADZ90_019470 [Aestuariibius sp. 2305UL40-4]